jgi:LCP family protein required for cell wall assembly
LLVEENDLILSRVDQRKKLQRRILIGVAIVLLAAILGLFTYSGYTYWNFINKIAEGKSGIGEPNGNGEQVIRLENRAFATLIIGLDARPGMINYNTDVLIVAILNPETKKTSLLSIPRDIKVTVPGYGDHKINALYSIGEHEKILQENRGEPVTASGIDLLLKAVSDFLDIPVEHYAFLDFKGFEAIIDKLGGITVNVDRYMHYIGESDGTYINLRPGEQRLSGKQALDFARFRLSSDGNDSNDFARNRRQQEIIRAFVDELKTVNGLSNIFGILNTAGDHIKLSFSKEEILPLILKYKGLQSSDIETIKFEAEWESPYVVVSDAEMDRVKAELKERFKVSEK